MDTVTGLAILSVYFFLLGLGGIVAEHILPHISLLDRYFDTLPDWEDDGEYSAETRERLGLKKLQELLRTLQHISCPACITK